MLPNPAQRFSGRVESYRRSRPGYPAELVETLRQQGGLANDAHVADIAAGTGLLTEVLLLAGFSVTAVEPNDEMRAACAQLERGFSKLRCVSGTAEATGLPDASVDLITVAQAMHWFDLQRARREFARILRPGGWCAVIYNNRHLRGDKFHEDYEQFLLRFGTDYLSVKQQHVGRNRLAEFFAPSPMQCAVFPNAQSLTADELRERVLSSSYIPGSGQPGYAEMSAALERLFAENQSGGMVTMRYDCVACWGRLS